MASLTLSLTDAFKNQLGKFLWVNWSEIAREEITKKLVFEHYLKTGNLLDEEWDFCQKKDWHPVDELPLKESFKKELTRRKKEKSIPLKSVSELFKR